MISSISEMKLTATELSTTSVGEDEVMRKTTPTPNTTISTVSDEEEDTAHARRGGAHEELVFALFVALEVGAVERNLHALERGELRQARGTERVDRCQLDQRRRGAGRRPFMSEGVDDVADEARLQAEREHKG
jgi:hypothetical protein